MYLFIIYKSRLNLINYGKIYSKFPRDNYVKNHYNKLQREYRSNCENLREQPFNLKAGGGVMAFCFVPKFFFRQHKSQNIYFFCRANFTEFNIRLYDKNSESDYFLHQNQNIFFSNIVNQNIFLEKNHNPPSS